MDDRRRSVRITYRTKVRISKNTPRHDFLTEGVIKNINRRGFAFMCEDPLSRGLSYRFSVDVMGFPLNFTGHVVHFHELETYCVAGILFDSMPLFDRIRFNQFLVARDGGLKIRYLVFSIVIGAVVGITASAMFGWSNVLAWTLFCLVALLHFAFPPF